jgi:UDP-glucose 4-epimerase
VAEGEGRRILITGISGELAGQLARRLEDDERVEYLVGVDLREPRHDLSRTEFVRADLRNPLVAKVVDSTRVDTIVHLAVTAEPYHAGGRSRTKELNVIGTMQLLAAAQKSDRLRGLVMKSTNAVYGSSYKSPALFRENAAPEAAVAHGYTKDAVEIEGYARAFGRRRDDVALSILRFANFVGPTVDTPLTRYFSLPVIPTALGFDPRLQLCHETDAIEVLRRATLDGHRGIYNVAGPGCVYLSQAIRLTGKPTAPVPLPFVNATAGLVRRTGRVDFSPEQLRLLLYGRVGDITRLRHDFGYEPAYTTRAAFEEFISSQRIKGVVDRDAAARWERELYGMISRGKAHLPRALTRRRDGDTGAVAEAADGRPRVGTGGPAGGRGPE